MTLSSVQISAGRCPITAGELIWLAHKGRKGVGERRRYTKDSRDLAHVHKQAQEATHGDNCFWTRTPQKPQPVTGQFDNLGMWVRSWGLVHE